MSITLATSNASRLCSQCGAEKPLDDFYEQAKGRDGRMAHCIACNNDRPPTEARIIRQRARHRATARLLEEHRDEFTRLLEEETVKARTEHARLAEKAAATGNDDAAIARLRPGQKRRTEQDAADRLDVARCRSCHTHHDAEHECPSCGDTTPSRPITATKPWEIREWAQEQGIEVPTRGPIPRSVQVAFEAAAYDEAAVLRRLDGDLSVPLTKADRLEIVRRARLAGWSLLDLEHRAGIPKAERYITDREDVAS